QRYAAVVDAAAGDVARPGAVDLRIEAPAHRALAATADVDGIDPPPAVRHIHHAVLDDRRGFHRAKLTATAALVARERNREGDLEILDVAGVEGLERREPVTLIVAMVQDPVLRLLGRIDRALLRHVG